MSVVGWLTHSQQKEYDFPFEVTDVRETESAPSPSVLADVVKEAYWGDNYLEELVSCPRNSFT